MKTIVYLFFLSVFISLPAFGQESKTNSPSKRIPASEAKEHVNAEAIVSGKVVELYRTDKLVRINLDKPFPNQPFTVVIFPNKTNLFPDLEKLKGKSIEVTGKITEYREQPQIILLNTNQLKVIESKADSDKQ
jgi:DNA/RNA endonuclease YhcR with UshA esterase domain